MRMNKILFYFKVIGKSFKSQYVYVTQIYSKILYSIISYSIQMYVWNSIDMLQINKKYDMVYMSSYVLLSSIIGTFIAFDTNYIPVVESKVKNGDIGTELSKPYSFLYYTFCEYLGKCWFKLIFNAVPLYIFARLLGMNFDFNRRSILFFSISVILAMLIFFLICINCGLLSFWFVSIGNMHIIIDSCITLFSGAIIPLWLIPEKFLFVYDMLPFKYLYYYPIAICINTINVGEAFHIYLFQLVWICILSFSACVIYSRGLKRLQVLGG